MEASRTTGVEGDPEPSLTRRFLVRLAGISVWLYLAAGFALGALTQYLDGPWWLAFCFYLLGGVLPIVLQTVPAEETAATAEFELTNRERAIYLYSVFRWAITPWGIYTQLRQLGGQVAAAARYRDGAPSIDRHVPATALRLPFDGEWTVVNGGVTEATSHSWEILSQRYAYDFVVTDEDGNSHAGDGDDLADYYAYGRPIHAPADGTVVAVSDGRRDYPHPGSAWLEWRTWDIAGNHVTIEHADGEYSFLAHLLEGSTTVAAGDSVTAGDVIGKCGNSGHSTEPHLHYQLQDGPSFWTAASLVPRFAGVDVEREDTTANEDGPYAAAPSSEGTYLVAGDLVQSSG